VENGLARALRDRGSNRGGVGLSILLAFLGHGVLALLVPKPAQAQIAPPPMKQTIELEPPPPEPAKEVPPPEPEKPSEPPPKAAPASAPPAQAAPPPPAQAAAVLTQQNDEPADFSNSIVVGTAATYAGGQSAANGTTTRRVVTTGKGTGGAGTAAVAPAPSGPNRAKRARLAGGAAWDCPFPSEADAAQIDHAVVTLRITVAQSGATRSVSVEGDPGNGFGREARACAMRKQFEPALDAEGNPVEGSSLINVRFDR
jgi:periplasmic protein TonB